MTTNSKLALAFLLLLSAEMCAQGTGPVVPPHQDEEADNDTWSFAVAGYGYIVPDDQSYFSPTFRADRNGRT